MMKTPSQARHLPIDIYDIEMHRYSMELIFISSKSLQCCYIVVITYIADVVVYNLGSAPTQQELEPGNFHSTHGDSVASNDTICQGYGWVLYFLSIDICNGMVMVFFTFGSSLSLSKSIIDQTPFQNRNPLNTFFRQTEKSSTFIHRVKSRVKQTNRVHDWLIFWVTHTTPITRSHSNPSPRTTLTLS